MVQYLHTDTQTHLQNENVILRQRIKELEHRLAEITSWQDDRAHQTIDVSHTDNARSILNATLQESEKSLYALLNAVQASAFLMDVYGIVLMANQTLAARLGTTVEHIIGKNLIDLLPHDVAKERAERAQQVIQTKQALRFEDMRNNRYLDNTICPVLDNEGNVTRLAVFALDITEQKQTETELCESQARLQAIFDNAAVGIGLMDTNGDYIQVNERWCHMLGYERDDDIYLSRLTDVVSPHQAAQSRAQLVDMLRGTITRPCIELQFVRRDGSLFWADLSLSRMDDERGQFKSIVAIMSDITHRKEIEEVLKHANEEFIQWVTELEQRNRETTSLNEMGDELQGCQTLGAAYDVIGQFGPKLFRGYAGTLFMLDESRQNIETVAWWGEQKPCEQAFTPDVCWALGQRQEYMQELQTVESSACMIGDTQTHSSPLSQYICVPLITQEETFGMLHLRRTTTESNRDRYKWVLQLATTVGEHLAMALSNIHLRQRLHYQSIRDPLTGLFNRRYMDESLNKEIHRAIRNHHPIGIIMIDIDHFKRFNDTYGHDGGDALLRALGTFLQTHIRSEDIACRYGGEEILLILPTATLEDTLKRAESIRQEIQHIHIAHHSQSHGHDGANVTASLGVASFPEHGATAEEIIKSADAALYQAKAAGRDRVVVATMGQQEDTSNG